MNYTLSEKNYQNIPYELKERNQWICHDAGKRPINPRTGQYASSTNPATWASFDEAVSSPHGIGIGFVFSESDPFTGIDLDVPEGQQLSPEQLNIIEYFSSYTEYSVSGRGAHIIVKGALPEGCRKAGIEIYPHGRYFTFTGNSFHSQPLPIADRQNELSKAYEFLKRPTCEETHIDTNQNHASVISDEQLIAFICGSGTNSQHWFSTDPADWSASYHAILNAACVVSSDEQQIKRVLTGSPLVSETPPKNGETRLEKMLRLWSDEYPLAAAKGGVERCLEAERVELGSQLSEGLFVKPVGNSGPFLTAEDIKWQPPMQWVIKGVLPETGLACVYGASGSGKSFLTLELAAAIAGGSNFFGYKTKQRAVLYVALEGEAGYRARISAHEMHHGQPMESGQWLRFHMAGFELNNRQHVEALAKQLPRGCVVIVDTLNRSAPGMDENSSKDTGQVIAAAKMLQSMTNGLVLLVAHTGKNSEAGLRGHSSLFAALDAAIRVNRNGEVRCWLIDKAKDGEDGKTHNFKLKQYVIGTDEDGEEITSCAIIPSGSPHSSNKPLPPALRFALDSFKLAAVEHGYLNENGDFDGLALDDWRRVFYEQHIGDNVEAKKKAFQRARSDLQKAGLVSVANDVYRLQGPDSFLAEFDISQKLRSGTRSGTRDKAGHVPAVPTLL